MFLNTKPRKGTYSMCGRAYYGRDGEQKAYGSFLVLVTPQRSRIEGKENEFPDSLSETRAFVKFVKLRQSGHFMIGFMDLAHLPIPDKEKRFYVSGSYGCDGLPKTVSDELYDRCVPVPRELMEAWNKGGGHNCAGSEGPSIRAWAEKNISQLRCAVRKS